MINISQSLKFSIQRENSVVGPHAPFPPSLIFAKGDLDVKERSPRAVHNALPIL